MSKNEGTIIVTGASGFLGSALLVAITNQGGRSLGVVRRLPGNRSPQGLVATDLLESSDGLLNAIAERRAPILIHCALPHRESFTADAAGADSLTERIDSNVIRACVESASMSRVVLVSSSAVYGELKTSELAFGETHPPNPVSEYGQTKLHQEKRWKGALGTRLVIARVFNVTGHGEPTSMVAGALAQRIADADSQSALPLHNSESVRDFSDVRDVARALILISRLDATAPRYFNISSGIGTKIRDLANLIVMTSGRQIKIEADVKGAESRSVGDARLLRSSTGWQPTISLEESAKAVWNSRAAVSRGAAGPSVR